MAFPGCVKPANHQCPAHSRAAQCWARVPLPATLQSMIRPVDTVLLVLIALLLASLSAFFLGLIPYPYGLLILAAFIAARVLQLLSTRK